jgi:integrase
VLVGSRDRRALWRACGDDQFGTIVKLLLLTGCRRMEICGLRWLDFVAERQP